MKITDMFPKKYASGEDLNGKPVTLTIVRIALEEMHPQPGAPASKKYVLYFNGAKRGVILTRPLALQIATIHGDETDNWKGKRIQLYPEPMNVAGQARVAIRARTAPNGPDTPPPAMVAGDDDDD